MRTGEAKTAADCPAATWGEPALNVRGYDCAAECAGGIVPAWRDHISREVKNLAQAVRDEEADIILGAVFIKAVIEPTIAQDIVEILLRPGA